MLYFIVFPLSPHFPFPVVPSIPTKHYFSREVCGLTDWSLYLYLSRHHNIIIYIFFTTVASCCIYGIQTAYFLTLKFSPFLVIVHLFFYLSYATLEFIEKLFSWQKRREILCVLFSQKTYKQTYASSKNESGGRQQLNLLRSTLLLMGVVCVSVVAFPSFLFVVVCERIEGSVIRTSATAKRPCTSFPYRILIELLYNM